MKNTISIITYTMLVLIFNSCGSSVKKSQYNNKGIEQFQDFTNSTAYEFPELIIPNAYYLDSLFMNDRTIKSNYTVFFIQAIDSSRDQFNNSIRKTIDKHITIDQSYLNSNDLGSLDEYSYYARPIELYSNQQVISISQMIYPSRSGLGNFSKFIFIVSKAKSTAIALAIASIFNAAKCKKKEKKIPNHFVMGIDTYTEGGNHHNYEIQTFNYDLLKNKTIEFSDVFSIQSKQDSIEFISYLEQHVTEGCSDAWGSPYSYLDFSFSAEGITINPNLSWACSGTRSILPLDSTNRFIRNEWIK